MSTDLPDIINNSGRNNLQLEIGDTSTFESNEENALINKSDSEGEGDFDDLFAPQISDPCRLGNSYAFCYKDHNPLFVIGPECVYIINIYIYIYIGYMSSIVITMILIISGIYTFGVILQRSKIQACIGILLTTSELFLYICACIINPGIPDRNILHALTEEKQKYYEKMNLICHRCEVIQNSTTHHCIQCNICIQGKIIISVYVHIFIYIQQYIY